MNIAATIDSAEQSVENVTQQPSTPIFDEDGLHVVLSEIAQSKRSITDPVFNTNVTQLPWLDHCKLTGADPAHAVEFKGVLFDTFLMHLSSEQKKQYNCTCCREFVRKVGGLVSLDKDTGKTTSLIWDENKVQEKFKASVKAMREMVERATITQVFQSNHTSFGKKYAGGYAHMCLDLEAPIPRTHAKRIDTAPAISKEDFKTLKHYLDELPDDLADLKLALTLFKTHKALAGYYTTFQKRVEDMVTIAIDYKSMKHELLKPNVIWFAVAIYSPAIIHFSNTVLGQFVERLGRKGELYPDPQMVQDEAIHFFRKNTKPEKYMRPTEPPKQGTVNQGNKIIAELGLEKSFARRWASVDDLNPEDVIWHPKAEEESSTEKKKGFFDDVKVKDAKPTVVKPSIHGGVMTWAKFAKTFLNQAEKIKLVLNHSKTNNWTGILTAVHPDCEPILRWDKKEKRDHLSFFSAVNDSTPSDWGLGHQSLVEIEQIIKNPIIKLYPSNHEFEVMPVALIMKNVKHQNPIGVGLFPQIVRPELFEIHSVIEAYSNQSTIVDHPEPVSAYSCYQGSHGFALIVTTEDAEVSVTIDRFE